MKNVSLLLIALVFFLVLNSGAQNSESNAWSPISASEIRLSGKRQIIPQKFRTYTLKVNEMRDKLFSAPSEKSVRLHESAWVITLPLPDGSLQRFRVVESPVMAEALAAAFPDIKTFNVKGIDDPYANGKLDWNEFGFHGMVLSVNGDFFIDPYCIGNTTDYISYYTRDFVKDPSHVIPEMLPAADEGQKKPAPAEQEKTGLKSAATAPAVCVGAQLRTYRLAVACTGEYAIAATGNAAPTIVQTLGKIVTSVNRVNAVYETEVAVRLILVATETLVVFTSASADPFTGNNNASTLINESHTVITNTIGATNFDIGHTFSTGAGGYAFLGVVCNGGSKAKGITGSASPVGDPYDIDYVCHEMGHQFNANHTFNALTGSCSGNRFGPSSVEPGSGITIMAYAGICTSNNLANNSIPYFHGISYDEIVNFTTTGAGNGCDASVATGNQPPFVTGSAGYIIPKATPFILTGSATDPDGDVLSYSWEETDPGIIGHNAVADSMPYFRSYPPVTAPVRSFPSNNFLLAGNYTAMGEYLPKTSQTLHFRLTARDKQTGGGGVCYANNTLTISSAGPFTVTYPSATDISWGLGTTRTITWDVNGTDEAPVDCDSVSIWISYDGGNSYSVLVPTAPNNGATTITAPTVTIVIPTCRIKVECKGNIFFDVSNNNFTVSPDPKAGINQVSLNNPVNLSVWPNPFTNQLTFSAANLTAKSPTAVYVIDVLGRTVFQRTYTGKTELKEELDLSKLGSGVYFIKVTNDARQSFHRVVKD